LVQLRFDLYVISCKLELGKIGVAGDAQKRLREFHVGSAAVGVTTRTLGNWKEPARFSVYRWVVRCCRGCA
jgi:hypothetical protein